MAANWASCAYGAVPLRTVVRSPEPGPRETRLRWIVARELSFCQVLPDKETVPSALPSEVWAETQPAVAP